MVYNSLWDQIEKKRRKWNAKDKPLSFDGPFLFVLNKLMWEFEKQKPDPDILALYPPRVIRAIIDYKIEHPETEGRIEPYVMKAVDFALSVYRNHKNTEKLFDECNGLLKALQKDFLDLANNSAVRQTWDSETWDATHPDSSKVTASKLEEMLKGTEVLFIPMAHGGVPAGLDVFLRYCDGKLGKSVFYPVRFSRGKHNDFSPRISNEELRYLTTEASNRKVVVFDEDSYSNNTLWRVVDLFFNQTFHKIPIIVAINYMERYMGPYVESAEKTLNLFPS